MATLRWNCRETFLFVRSLSNSHKVKMAAKLRAEYSAVLHMPVLKEGKDRVSHTSDQYEHQSYSHPGEYYPDLGYGYVPVDMN